MIGKIIISTNMWRFIIAALLGLFGISACSGGGGSTTTPVSISNPNLMGINISAPLDYSEDRLFADAIKTARDFIAGSNPDAATLATVDGNGWPTQDFSFYVFANMANMNGNYALSYTGKAKVTANGVSLSAIAYDSGSNTSTGVVTITATGQTFLSLVFTNTMSDGSTPGTGVKNIKLMRPTSPGASTPYPTTTTFTNPIKALISKFSAIRFMDYLATNSNQQTKWTDRPLPTWASYNRDANTISTNTGESYGWEGIGGSWEHAVQLANETGKDLWINIPALVDDAYVTNVANLLKYGSDGQNPYTSAQASPAYPPLNPNLHVYVEYSNELWNTAGAFSQSSSNCQAASDELAAASAVSAVSPINWDNSWNGITYNNAHWDPNMCYRRAAERIVQISNLFRAVFGDAAMQTRIRPVMESQLTNAGGPLFQQASVLMNYYGGFSNSVTGVTPHPPNYYIYGAGGSGYYNVSNPSTLTSVDQVFSSPDMLPSGFDPILQEDMNYVSALGVKRVAYEGGPSFDTTGTTLIDSIYAQAVLDPRIKTAMVNMHNQWSADGGDLLMYFTATGDYQWGFTPSIFNLNTYKLAAIDSLNAANKSTLTYGAPVPASIDASNATSCSRGYGCAPIQSYDNFTADASKFVWANYAFRSDTSSTWTITLTVANPTSGSNVSVYVDGAQVDSTKPASAGAVSFSAGVIGSGVHGVVIKANSGAFAVTNLRIATQ
jgi:hypothetical protein